MFQIVDFAKVRTFPSRIVRVLLVNDYCMYYQSLVGHCGKAMSACTSQGCWPVALEILQPGPERLWRVPVACGDPNAQGQNLYWLEGMRLPELVLLSRAIHGVSSLIDALILIKVTICHNSVGRSRRRRCSLCSLQTC